jgi:hypothetical protein
MTYNNVPNGSVLYNADWLTIGSHQHTGNTRDGDLLRNPLFVGGSVTVSGTILPTGNGGAALGLTTQAFSYLYLKDISSANVYRFQISGGVLQLVLI